MVGIQALRHGLLPGLQASRVFPSRLIHSASNPTPTQGDIPNKNNPSSRSDIYHKNLLNEKGHKNVFFNNYRITTTLIGEKSRSKRITTEAEAKQFVKSLTPAERMIIKDELILDEKENADQKEPQAVVTPGFRQMVLVAMQSGIPFIGFGFVDNFIMIIAGDTIEIYLGTFLPISTMAAAGLGNAISDVGGIGLAHHIEYYCSKIIQAPKLSPEQWNIPLVGWVSAISKSLCIFIGCLIGMVPLLFIDHEKKDSKSEEKEAKSDNPKGT